MILNRKAFSSSIDEGAIDELSSFRIDICCGRLGYARDVVTNEAIIMKRMKSTKKYNRLIYKEKRKEED